MVGGGRSILAIDGLDSYPDLVDRPDTLKDKYQRVETNDYKFLVIKKLIE